MGSKCKAVVWASPSVVEIVERPIPSPGPGQALLQIRAAGICGTDLHILSGKHPEARPPLVLGHEFAGVVTDVGPGVEESLVGMRVGSDSYVGCGECIYCLSKKPQLCERGTCELGINIDGGWAEYVVLPAGNLYRLPDGVEFFEAGAGCILNCPMAAIEKVRVDAGDMVLIIGDGPSSLIMVQLARLKGASQIIISGHRELRLSLALKLGADRAINTCHEDLAESIKELSSAPRVVVDAVGTAETFAIALELAGREARVHLFGLPEGPMNNLPLDILLFKELTVVSSTGAPSLWPAAMTLISHGLLKIAPLISQRFLLENAPEALEFVKSNRHEVIKAVFEMNGREL